jgi:hypothetical protein
MKKSQAGTEERKLAAAFYSRQMCKGTDTGRGEGKGGKENSGSSSRQSAVIFERMLPHY